MRQGKSIIEHSSPTLRPLELSDELKEAFEPNLSVEEPTRLEQGRLNRELAFDESAELVMQAGDRQHLMAAARKLMKLRRERAELVPRSLLGEPGWDLLLAIYTLEPVTRFRTIARVGARAATTNSTALRTLGKLEEATLVTRRDMPNDARSSILSLTEECRNKLDRYFEAVLITWND